MQLIFVVILWTVTLASCCILNVKIASSHFCFTQAYLTELQVCQKVSTPRGQVIKLEMCNNCGSAAEQRMVLLVKSIV